MFCQYIFEQRSADIKELLCKRYVTMIYSYEVGCSCLHTWYRRPWQNSFPHNCWNLIWLVYWWHVISGSCRLQLSSMVATSGYSSDSKFISKFAIWLLMISNWRSKRIPVSNWNIRQLTRNFKLEWIKSVIINFSIESIFMYLYPRR